MKDIKMVSSAEEMENCFLIRRKVFIEGQGVDEDLEIDGKDAESKHFILYFEKKPVGTARIRTLEKYIKIERVAILNEFQGKGLGNALMNAIIEYIKKEGVSRETFLSAQKQVVDFYKKLGFEIVDRKEYLDAGIVHLDMKMIL